MACSVKLHTMPFYPYQRTNKLASAIQMFHDIWYMTEDQNIAEYMYGTHRNRQCVRKLVVIAMCLPTNF